MLPLKLVLFYCSVTLLPDVFFPPSGCHKQRHTRDFALHCVRVWGVHKRPRSTVSRLQTRQGLNNRCAETPPDAIHPMRTNKVRKRKSDKPEAHEHNHGQNTNPGSSALGCVVYVVMFLKSKGNVLSGIISYCFVEERSWMSVVGELCHVYGTRLWRHKGLFKSHCKWIGKEFGSKSFSNQERCDGVCLSFI